MKIALLGPSDSGKTVYFSGLSYKYRNFVGFRPLSKADLSLYESTGVKRRVALRLSFNDSNHEREINEHIKLLSERPITRWPEKTIDLDATKIISHFYFSDINDPHSDLERHTRHIEIYDPPGEALGGLHSNSGSIINRLCSCDVTMAFLPADLLLDAVKYGDPERVLNGAYFGKINEIILSCAARISSENSSDMMPVCFVISKADLLQSLHENVIIDARNMLYNEIILPFSRMNPNMTICVCPVSVLDPSTGNFEASNLEWPFVFSAAGTVFRNSLVLRQEASSARYEAEAAERAAETLRQGGSTWSRFKAWWNNDGVSARRQRAQSFYTRYGRLVGEAEDDRALAKAAWVSLGVEGKAKHVKVFVRGEEFDPALIGGKL